MFDRRLLWCVTLSLSVVASRSVAQPASALVDIVANCGADPTGTLDSSAAIQNCFNLAATPPGKIVFVPPGTFRVDTTVVYQPAATPPVPQRVPSLIMRGAGRYTSVFDNRVSGGPMLKLQPQVITSPPTQFQIGGELSDFGIITTTSPAASDGIYIKGVWQLYMRNVRIEGLERDGVVLRSDLGDPDGPVSITFENCMFWFNQGFGMRMDNAAGRSNISSVAIRDSRITGNQGGGITWNGKQLEISNSAITENMGAGGLIVPWAPQNFKAEKLNVIGTAFENNSPLHLHMEALLSGFFAGCQFTSSLEEFFPSSVAVRVGSNPPPNPLAFAENVTFLNTTVDVAPAYDSHVLFDITGAAINTVVTQTVWRRYDGTGQRRYSDNYGAALFLNAGANHNVSLLERELIRVTAPGNFTITGLKLGPGSGDLGGNNARIVRILNASGFTMTLTHQDAGSAADNRLMLKGGVAVVVPHMGTATLVYDAANDRWWMLATQ